VTSETPLSDLLRSVPEDVRIGWDEPGPLRGTRWVAIGALSHRAAHELDTLRRQRDAFLDYIRDLEPALRAAHADAARLHWLRVLPPDRVHALWLASMEPGANLAALIDASMPPTTKPRTSAGTVPAPASLCQHDPMRPGNGKMRHYCNVCQCIVGLPLSIAGSAEDAPTCKTCRGVGSVELASGGSGWGGGGPDVSTERIDCPDCDGSTSSAGTGET
jgi:hypothetical protein